MGTSGVIFGTAGLTALPTYGAALRLLAEAERAGIGHFDTAPIYGQGYAEWILGRYLARSRSRALVTTKFGLSPARGPVLHPALAMPLNHLRRRLSQRGGMPPPVVSPGKPELPHRTIPLESVQASLHDSMKRLGRRRIDVYLLHEGLPSFLGPGVLGFLEERQRQGEIGCLGVGTNAGILAAAAGEDLGPFEVLQYEAGPEFQTLKARYPEKTHHLHGCLRLALQGQVEASRISSALAGWASQNPDGKLLFFTSRPSVLKRNMDAIRAI